MISITSRFREVCKSYHLLNLFLTLILLAIFFADLNYFLPCDPRGRAWRGCLPWQKKIEKFLLFIYFYFFYLFECGSSETKAYLSNNRKAISYEDYIKKIKTAALKRKAKDFQSCYISWELVTEDIPEEVSSKNLVILETERISERKVKACRKDHIHLNLEKDEDIQNPPRKMVSGFQKAFFHKKGTKRPFYLNLACFWILSVFLLSWPYRMWLEYVSDRKKIVLRKVIHT